MEKVCLKCNLGRRRYLYYVEGDTGTEKEACLWTTLFMDFYLCTSSNPISSEENNMMKVIFYKYSGTSMHF